MLIVLLFVVYGVILVMIVVLLCWVVIVGLLSDFYFVGCNFGVFVFVLMFYVM